MTILLRENKKNTTKITPKRRLNSLPFFCRLILLTQKKKRHRKKRQRMGTSMPLLTKRINLLFESWEKEFLEEVPLILDLRARNYGKGPHNGTIRVGPLWYEWRRRLCLFYISLQMLNLASSSIKWAEECSVAMKVGPTLLNDRQDNRHNTSIKPGTTLSLQIQK